MFYWTTARVAHHFVLLDLSCIQLVTQVLTHRDQSAELLPFALFLTQQCPAHLATVEKAVVVLESVDSGDTSKGRVPKRFAHRRAVDNVGDVRIAILRCRLPPR